MMMAYERSESTQDNFGKFIHQFQPETKTFIRKIERVKCKTVLFQIIQFSISMQLRCQNNSISSNSV